MNATVGYPSNRINGLQDASCAKREPAVQMALLALEKQIEELAATVSSLEDRLTSITQPQVPQPCQDQKDPDAGVPLVRRIDGAFKAVSVSVHRIQRLLNALEL